ncbi:MAG: L,D-transpeptidase [Gammaproteobacteria bacterium]|nr:L,D-transpeptidase [Gammaproteobacteria bacterium]
MRKVQALLTVWLIFHFLVAYSAVVYEIDASPFGTANAPLPQYIKAPQEKLIVVDPSQHVFGAYSPEGKLIRWGLASAGSSWCSDINKSCETTPGNYRVYSLGDESCISSKFPLAEAGGAPMPYCMFFNGGQALHGANEVAYANTSHGCVRLHLDDAQWLRYHFVERPQAENDYHGTRVLIKTYNELSLNGSKRLHYYQYYNAYQQKYRQFI